MSCWVVPTIAAELWGVTVGHVLAGIRDGSIESRDEHGFVFVDAARQSSSHPRHRPGEPSPPTFVAVSRADAVEEDTELPPLDDEENDAALPPRQMMRAAVSRLRKPPVAA